MNTKSADESIISRGKIYERRGATIDVYEGSRWVDAWLYTDIDEAREAFEELKESSNEN